MQRAVEGLSLVVPRLGTEVTVLIDHRVSDGVQEGDLFMGALAGYFEDPLRLLIMIYYA